MKFDLAPTHIYIPRNGKIAITTVVPADNEFLEIEGTAMEMFTSLIEKSLTVQELVKYLGQAYPDIDSSIIESDLNQLVGFLLEKKVIIQKA